MTDSKGLLKSTAAWGGIITLLPVLDNILVSLGVLDGPLLSDSADVISASVGGILAILGRIKAQATIKGWL